MESITLPLWHLASGTAMIYFNKDDSGSTTYFWLGIVHVTSVFFFVIAESIVMAYNVINATYLQSRYNPGNWATIQFGTIINAYGAKDEDSLIKTLLYLEQLFIGNKRLNFYANLMMSIVSSFHPITLPIGMYYITQLPIQMILDLIVYPVWPQFDTPQIPWWEFFN